MIETYFYEIFDSLLILTGKIKENSKLIHIYNINSCKRIVSFASKGRGPNEFMEVLEFQILPETREIFVPDLLSQVSRLYNIDSLLLEKKDSPLSEISFHGSKFNGIRKLDSSAYLCDYGRYHIPGELMYVKMKAPSMIVTDSVYYPPIEHSDKHLPVSEYRSVFRNRSSYNANAGKIVLSFSKTDLLEVYDKDLNRLVRIHGPDRFFPKWEQSGMNIKTSIPGSHRGYNPPFAGKEVSLRPGTPQAISK